MLRDAAKALHKTRSVWPWEKAQAHEIMLCYMDVRTVLGSVKSCQDTPEEFRTMIKSILAEADA